MLKDILLFGGSPGRGESVAGILDPAAGETAAVVRVVAAPHGDLVAVIDERDAAGGQQKSERQPEPSDRRPFVAHKPAYVMQAQEGDQSVGVGIEMVARELLGQLPQALPRRKRPPNSIIQWEIEQQSMPESIPSKRVRPP
jgi:hypothetical protein